jgi:drug/metabolite transporter (DMT)-like permease
MYKLLLTNTGIVSLAFADMITLSSAAPLTMVFNLLLSVFVLKNKFTKTDLLSIFLISVGASICMIYSNYKEETYTVNVSNILSYQPFNRILFI